MARIARRGWLSLRFVAAFIGLAGAAPADGLPARQEQRASLPAGASKLLALGTVGQGRTYRLLVSLETTPLDPDERIAVELRGSGHDPIRKILHAGDPDMDLPYRPATDGHARLGLRRENSAGNGLVDVRIEWHTVPAEGLDRAAIEAEPNDDVKSANTLVLGRDVYGSADDVDYLENKDEGRSGLDWFRFEVEGSKPVLVFFQLDLLDRDVSANLRVYTLDPKTGHAVPYLTGKDPMEIVHDRERERYSKHISRTFTKGTYYLEVNANHPSYILRTRVLPVPPYDDPRQAVEAGMHYIINVGDAWFAQVPREGNIFVRADNLHDTATRCTACHPSSFSTEANLAAHRNGYPIRSKSNFQYVMDRISNSVTPQYGNDGLFWQRFIAIPLQAQGMQGSILADFENQVTGQPTKILERFGPFLRAAWETRTNLPADEQNGVIPLDSKFGFAWRDWRVLDELARRTGRPDDARAAENLARILGSRTADRQIESLQDRIHRLHAWWLIDRAAFASKIKRETGALLALQNADGGWHETDGGPGASAVYTTGQLLDVLLETGLPRDHPAVARGLRYLLSQQQEFGGWFQTTTHENFRTPMRETRYAVMALARAFPLPGAPLHSWGNRDDGPARRPRTDSLVHTLDDLENLWDVPANERSYYTHAILPLLGHPDVLVRSTAAACLGRIGTEDAVDPLCLSLNDPSKIVWRAAAWALRRLGNQGVGVEAIRSALNARDPRVRRGATRIFAYQFQGMDTHIDLARRLLAMTGDPDLWTRLQALRTLRQWFYRTSDRDLQRSIVENYLARMAQPDASVIRKNLSEGLYIMLDENLGGGVSLQKNIAELPESLRPGILEARKSLEREVLLGPVFSALEHGNTLQRAGVLQAFDGSFFKGRFYARQPENMIDVGNDREFGFLYEPPLEDLERIFVALLKAELPAGSRRQAIQLCSFFKVPERTANAEIQMALLRALADQAPDVRAVARAVVSRELTLVGAEQDGERIKAVRALLLGSSDSRASVLSAIGRNTRLGTRAEIVEAMKGLLHRAEAAAELLPVLGRAEFSDADRIAIVERGWSSFSTDQRLAAIEVLLSHPEALDRPDPPESAVEILRRAVTDASPSVRERTLQGLRNLPRLWSSRHASGLLLSALADDSPAVRRLGMGLAASRASFWQRADALEHLARLLVDPDASVRSEALALVKHHRLLASHPPLARRIRALEDDPALAPEADALLRSAGLDPARVVADVPLTRPRLLSLGTFREKVNPIFYEPGADGQSCARCHANHTILRVAEADKGREVSGEQLMINYNSILKVVNLGDPESSLVLRKPRSPHGLGLPDPESPTGLTHVGGPRWDSTENPAYQTILSWVREASTRARNPAPDIKVGADSYSPGYEPGRAGDGDLSTIWHTEFVGATPGYPHELTLDLGADRKVQGLLYVPRQDSSNGRVGEFEIQLSADGRSWSEAVARGRWKDDDTYKTVVLPGSIARFVRLRGLSEVNGRPFMSAAEVVVDSTPVP
jgi:HEAT repeat protein